MTPIQIEMLGTFAVAAMLVCYAAEDRDPRFILAFAAACLVSATYAGLIGSWPFLVIEVLWAGIALRRFRRRRAVRAAR